MDGQPGGEAAAAAAGMGRRRQGRRPAAKRPPPARSAGLSHLSLGDLRDYRAELQAEESRVSYWRRILQARMDVLRTRGARAAQTDTVLVDRLKRVLIDAHTTSRRPALIAAAPADDVPPLPDLASLWDATEEEGDAGNDLLVRLAAAEAQLSDYRHALHRRLDEATGELMGRYVETPLLCLAALPRQPQAPTEDARRALPPVG